MYVEKGLVIKWKQNFNFYGEETYSLRQIFTAIVSVSFSFRREYNNYEVVLEMREFSRKLNT